jgi:IstB-like ATP binding protein
MRSQHRAGDGKHSVVDPTMTVVAIDRLVHHATILELNTESYRRRSALANAARAGTAAASSAVATGHDNCRCTLGSSIP